MLNLNHGENQPSTNKKQQLFTNFKDIENILQSVIIKLIYIQINLYTKYKINLFTYLQK